MNTPRKLDVVHVKSQTLEMCASVIEIIKSCIT